MAIDGDVMAFHELAQAKARYCRLLDSKDWSALSELLTDDLEFDLSDGDPNIPVIIGRDNVLTAVQKAVDGATTVHQVHAPEFDLRHGDARVIWAVQERVVWDNGTSLTAYGYYHDHWVRRGGQWKIAALRLTHQIMDFS